MRFFGQAVFACSGKPKDKPNKKTTSRGKHTENPDLAELLLRQPGFRFSFEETATEKPFVGVLVLAIPKYRYMPFGGGGTTGQKVFQKGSPKETLPLYKLDRFTDSPWFFLGALLWWLFEGKPKGTPTLAWVNGW